MTASDIYEEVGEPEKEPAPPKKVGKKKSPSKKKTTKTVTAKKRTRKKKKVEEQIEEKKAPTITPEAFFAPATEPDPECLKHLVGCRCILPQYKTWDDPPFHKFVVFSELASDGSVIPSLAQCNNCGIIHRVEEVGVSQTLRKEDSFALPRKEDIQGALPRWLLSLLQQHDCDLPTYQEAEFIIRNKLFGRFIILAREREGNLILGKACRILSENLHKIENFEMEEVLV